MSQQQPTILGTAPRYVMIPRLRLSTAATAVAPVAPMAVAAAAATGAVELGAPVKPTAIVSAQQPPPSSSASSQCSTMSGDDDPVSEFLTVRTGKKRRLDHLSHEEKFQRKKLKNRVAAQTSRDRKKAKLDDMEHQLQHMSDQNDALQRACTSLKAERDRALTRNAQLEAQIAQLTQRLGDAEAAQLLHQQAADVAARLSGCGTRRTPGSAVSSDATSSVPLPQEQREPQSTRRSAADAAANNSKLPQPMRSREQTAALLRIIALCLLYKTCSSSSTATGSKSSPSPCSPMSTQSWARLLERASAELPRRRAPRSGCLDRWWGPSQCSWQPPKIATATAV